MVKRNYLKLSNSNNKLLLLVMINNVNCDQIKCHGLNFAGRQSQTDSQSRTQGNGHNRASDLNNVHWTFFIRIVEPFLQSSDTEGCFHSHLVHFV